MGKIQVKKTQKLNSLLNNAFDLFTEKGITNTTISDIVRRAGVAKGTFYLYFKDKYDVRNRLILHKASQLFEKAYEALTVEAEKKRKRPSIEEAILFIIDYILGVLKDNKPLLIFLHKDLSWGVFRKALEVAPSDEDIDFEEVYREMISRSRVKFREPEIMLFLIIELAGSAGYSAIMYGDPVDLKGLTPYLHETIRGIIRDHTVRA